MHLVAKTIFNKFLFNFLFFINIYKTLLLFFINISIIIKLIFFIFFHTKIFIYGKSLENTKKQKKMSG